ncbi:hypothetical protein ACFL0W_05915 [Nanoarchaeota archaeon]
MGLDQNFVPSAEYQFSDGYIRFKKEFDDLIRPVTQPKILKHISQIEEICKTFYDLMEGTHKGSQIDLESMMIAAVGHDILCIKSREDHPQLSWEWTYDLLQDVNYNDNFRLDTIKDCILHHSILDEWSDGKPNTTTGDVFLDAHLVSRFIHPQKLREYFPRLESGDDYEEIIPEIIDSQKLESYLNQLAFAYIPDKAIVEARLFVDKWYDGLGNTHVGQVIKESTKKYVTTILEGVIEDITDSF